jgi:hypothetical protein
MHQIHLNAFISWQPVRLYNYKTQQNGNSIIVFIDHLSVFIIVSFLIAIYASVMAVYDSLNNTTEWD